MSKISAALDSGILTEQENRLFACDCAEHVLSLFEKVHPHDARPQKTVEVAKSFAKGNASLKDLVNAHEEAKLARRNAVGSPAWNAASAAMETSESDSSIAVREASKSACYAVAKAAYEATEVRAAVHILSSGGRWEVAKLYAKNMADEAEQRAWATEQKWQEKKLEKYLIGK